MAGYLAERYGITVERLIALDRDVYRVDGPGWVARWLPIGAEESAASAAELLRRLAPTKFPAERLAHPDPISICGGRPVLVTEFVAGRQAPGTGRMFAVLGRLLGGLHAHPGESLPPGGGWHHLVAQGSPRDEIDAATALLDTWDGDRFARATLLRELGDLDDGADLPHAIVHPDVVPANAILRPERGMVVVDWLGCGRGPRLWSLGFLLWAAGTRDLALVDAVMGGYREHVQLTSGELARLPDAIRGRPLTIDCWSVAHHRLTGAEAVERLDPRDEQAGAIADRVRRVLHDRQTMTTKTAQNAKRLRTVAGADRPDAAAEPAAAEAIQGELITETFDYAGGRQVRVYLPPDPPEAVVYAGDGQLISRWGHYLEAAKVPPTMIVAVDRTAEANEEARLREYSPAFDEQRFTACERFFAADVRRWVHSRFGHTLPAERTAVCGLSAGAEFALAMGLRHPNIYRFVFAASPGGGYRPPAVLPSSLPRAYLVAGTLEPFFLDNATRWADALRDAGAEVVMTEQVGKHGDPFWAEEFPLMVAWAFDR